jgi:hypothetical protein
VPFVDFRGGGGMTKIQDKIISMINDNASSDEISCYIDENIDILTTCDIRFIFEKLEKKILPLLARYIYDELNSHNNAPFVKLLERSDRELLDCAFVGYIGETPEVFYVIYKHLQSRNITNINELSEYVLNLKAENFIEKISDKIEKKGILGRFFIKRVVEYWFYIEKNKIRHHLCSSRHLYTVSDEALLGFDLFNHFVFGSFDYCRIVWLFMIRMKKHKTKYELLEYLSSDDDVDNITNIMAESRVVKATILTKILTLGLVSSYREYQLREIRHSVFVVKSSILRHITEK